MYVSYIEVHVRVDFQFAKRRQRPFVITTGETTLQLIQLAAGTFRNAG